MSFLENKNVLVTGGKGFLGSFVVEKLVKRGVKEENIRIPGSANMDLRIQENCSKAVEGMNVVIHMAAIVGGIGFNQKYPGTLFYDNIMMGIQLMEAARQAGVEKFVAVGTVCAYPKYVPVPFKEEDLWNGYPEETNAPYGLAKKMLLVQAQAYRQQYGMNSIFLLPVNLYGPRDNFEVNSSHVIPALIKKCLDAVKRNEKKIVVWGTGKATREFLYVEDAAEGIILASEQYNKQDPVNLGAGFEISISDLVKIIAGSTDFKGEVFWDASKPDGQPRRMLDTSKAKKEFGFEAKIPLEQGISTTVSWYKKYLEGE